MEQKLWDFSQILSEQWCSGLKNDFQASFLPILHTDLDSSQSNQSSYDRSPMPGLDSQTFYHVEHVKGVCISNSFQRNLAFLLELSKHTSVEPGLSA